MRRYLCPRCSARLFFETKLCVACGLDVGYDVSSDLLVGIDESAELSRCDNFGLIGCTWVSQSGECAGCRMTEARPDDDDVAGIAALRSAERAKRHMFRDFSKVGVSLRPKREDPINGIAFNMLRGGNVTIGHASGLITIDLAESQDSHRVRLQHRLAEPYRTMLGHMRHESGHYAEWQLVDRRGLTARAEALFGDTTQSYADAISRHYEQGPPDAWRENYVSSYATMHPWEDFAESWAHYLHISDALETAADAGFHEVGAQSSSFAETIVARWLPLATAANMLNESMGKDHLYPFTLAPAVIEKIAFMDSLVLR